MIQVKRNGDTFYEIEDLCEGSKFYRELGGDHYIKLKFSTEEPIYFEIGDTVELEDFGYFELISPYFPKRDDDTGAYTYEIQFDADYMAWKNKICKYRPKYGANETSFKLTSSIDVHLGVITSNLEALGLTHNGKNYTVDYTTYNEDAFDVTKRFYIEYSSTSIYEALNAICSEDNLDCDWWVDGSIIYLGFCEMKGQVTFEQDVNLASISSSESSSDHITRLYAFGSDRNIPDGYFTGTDADGTTDGIATDYLILPDQEEDEDGFVSKGGCLYNTNVVKNESQAIEGVVEFDDEYPKVSCEVSAIRTYESTVVNDDDTKTTQTFWQVTSNDSFATQFAQTWIKSNLDLSIKFTSGALNGMEFEASYKVRDNVKYFEIVANDTYGRTLPDTALCPKVGDTFFLFNWDATKITETDLIQQAQQSLLERAKTYYKKAMIDSTNFTCVLDAEKFYNDGTYDYHPLGEQVKLIHQVFSDTDSDGKHYRNSRIIGIEINLDTPYDEPKYIVGQKASYSRLGQLEKQVESVTVNGLQIGKSGSGSGVYVIGVNDNTPASDSNVYSARRQRLDFLSKKNDDIAYGLIQFLKGIGIGTSYGIDESGYAKLGEVLLDLLSSYDFNYSEQTGFAFTKRTDGKYKLSLTDLEVWGRAIFNQLEIRKLSYVGGNYIFSPAGSKIVCVQSGTEGILWTYYRCYYLADDGTTATQNLWSVGDLALCEEFNVVNHADNTKASNKRYWRKVVAVSSANEVITDDNGNELYGGQKFGYVDLSMRDCETGSDAPAAGDTIACVGNVSDTDRQNVITINTVGDDAPAIIQYSGINTYSLTDKVVTKLSPKGNVIKGELYTEDGKNVKENIGTLQEEMSGMSNSVSEIKQTAEKLSLTVTRTAVRDRNLLANSYVSLASTLYGFCTREVSLEKGKTYTLSVKGYSVASGGELKVYVFAEDSDGNWTWSNSVSITDTTETTASVTFSDVPSSGTYHVRCFSAPSGSNKLVFVRYIQLEEGEVATPWSMNEGDPAAYGNLLPDMGNNQWSYEDNVTKKDGVSLPDGNFYMTYHVENTETDDEDAIWLDSTFYPGNGESYTLSFWAKGSGVMNVWIDSACVYAITSEGQRVTAADGLVSFQLTTDWKRYWATWSTNVSDGQPREVNVMQVAGGSDVTAAGFKLEPYGRMTEYTQEQITGEDLLGTGIDIENKKITVTADQFTIQNNHGSKTFSVDANGLVTMNHIAVGGMINKCPVDVTKAKFATLFDTWQDIATNHWYGRPKMEQMYGIYYINEATGLSQTGMPLTLYMPSVYVNPDGQYYGDVFDDDGNLSNTLLRNVRSLVGNTILIYNESSEDIAINGMSPYFVDVWQSSSSAKAVTLQAASASTQTKGDTASDATDGLDKPVVDGDISPNERYVGRKRNELTVTLLGGKHHFVSLTCVCEVGHLGWENIYWLVNYGQAMNT